MNPAAFVPSVRRAVAWRPSTGAWRCWRRS